MGINSKLIIEKANKMQLNKIEKIISLFLFSSFSHAQSTPIEPDALLKLINTQQTPLIIDVRTAQEFTQGHIQGAINIDYRNIDHAKNLESYKDKQIIIYCHSGRRAKIASNILYKKGFKHLIDLHGHMIAWKMLNYPLIY
jgi:rhodanese-related sulfurtransferase